MYHHPTNMNQSAKSGNMEIRFPLSYVFCNSETNIFKYKYDSVTQAVLLVCASVGIVSGNNSSSKLTAVPLDNIGTCYADNEQSYSDTSSGNISEISSHLIMRNPQLNDVTFVNSLDFEIKRFQLIREKRISRNGSIISELDAAKTLTSYMHEK